jgi:DNA-directed RNA polymerase subunit E'/Rpb7
MIGEPKYKENDKVEFSFNEGEVHKGTVWIVDKYGTFLDKSDVSYDIYVEEENMLYKHINEKYVKRKINNQ